MRDGGNYVAVKISTDRSQETLNAQVEARLLKLINSKNGDRHGLISIIESFHFRSFFVIVFELLDINLYRYMKAPDFKGMKKEDLRSIAS
jgi:hypothetical protein